MMKRLVMKQPLLLLKQQALDMTETIGRDAFVIYNVNASHDGSALQ
jgi:hypothetical protein